MASPKSKFQISNVYTASPHLNTVAQSYFLGTHFQMEASLSIKDALIQELQRASTFSTQQSLQDRWDEELEQDIAAGKLDYLAQAALEALENGETTEL
ncbi:MAG: hypothetical protein AAF708_13520 [Deinococcota bacterium]